MVGIVQKLIEKGDNVKKLKRLAKKLAGAVPLLASVVGGPMGGGVADIALNLLGVKTEDEAIKALESHPDLLLQLKQYEMDNKLKLQELQLEAVRIHAADVQSARSREVEITRATGKRDMTQTGLAWLAVVGFIAVLIVSMVVELTPMQMRLVDMMAGALAGIVSGHVYGYYFGTSSSSQRKDMMVYQSGKDGRKDDEE